MTTPAPIFILGMPRCRTAWLSLCLSSRGIDCSHEGLRDHGDFDAYSDELNQRLACGPTGDADPSLAGFLDRLLERWPTARFVVVVGEDEEVLEEFISVAREDERDALRAGWGAYLTAFKAACDALRSGENACLFLRRADLASDEALLRVMEFVTWERPSALWAKRMQRLRVLSKVDSSECRVAATAGEIDVPTIAGLDVSELSARMYRNADYELVAEWWESHAGQMLTEAALPPVGVIVEDGGAPVCALWCYESFGVPVAELAFPVTRPGLTLAKAAAALLYAVAACISVAGKGHAPQASFRQFKVFAPAPMVRYLQRLGFKETLTHRVAMTLSL